MRRSYLFAYSADLGNYDEVKGFLNQCEIVTTWRHEINNLFFIVSDNTASDISDYVRRYFQNDGTFIVSEFSNNSQGWLTQMGWTFLENKGEKV